jgi:Pyruvate dehydrogenase complex, dehydrogenase (E1) component
VERGRDGLPRNRPGLGVGGHIATYASAATLYEVGFNHFFHGKDHGESGDQVFFQGTRRRASTPAPSSRAG